MTDTTPPDWQIVTKDTPSGRVLFCDYTTIGVALRHPVTQDWVWADGQPVDGAPKLYRWLPLPERPTY